MAVNFHGRGWGVLLVLVGGFLIWFMKVYVEIGLSYYYLRCAAGYCNSLLSNDFIQVAGSAVGFAVGCALLSQGVWMLQDRPRRIILAFEVAPLLVAACLFYLPTFLETIPVTLAVFYASMLTLFLKSYSFSAYLLPA